MFRIISVAAVFLVTTVSLGMVVPAAAGDVMDRPSDTITDVRFPPDVPHPSTPSEIRIHILYGAREFSTVQHPATDRARHRETHVWMPPFDSQSEDRWMAFDKVQHLTFSFLWTLGTQYVVVNKGRISEKHALPLSISSSAVAGVSKEVYDLRISPTRHFSAKDLVADAVGILLAAGIILL